MELSNENIIHVKKENIEYLQFKKLLEYPEISHGYVIGLDKSFKIYSNPLNDEIKKNELAKKSYKIICDELNLDYNNIVTTDQKHTNNIQKIDEKLNNDEPDFNIYKDTDGLITNKSNIILSTVNADCILLILYDPIRKVIANVHSGWRGTLQRISTKTVEKMQKEYNCDPKDIICCMSPSIRKEHFEVDEDVYKMFYEEFKDLNSENINIYSEKNNIDCNKYYIDTILINKLILKNKGLKLQNIIDSGICSVCNKDRIHSYRAKGKKAGRGTLVIALK